MIQKIKDYLPDVLFVAGLVLITAGVFMLSIPAGMIAAGASAMTWAIFLAKGFNDDYGDYE